MTAWDDGGWLVGGERALSPNQEARPAGTAVSLVVIHGISLPPGVFGGGWVGAFFRNGLPASAHPYFAAIAGQRVSAHFFVFRSGRTVQFVGCDYRAWHAGRSAWQGQEHCNDFSVGIELEGCDDTPYAAAQYDALTELIAALIQRYPIVALAGHCHIAPGRKTDPGPNFDWGRLGRCFPHLRSAAEDAP